MKKHVLLVLVNFTFIVANTFAANENTDASMVKDIPDVSVVNKRAEYIFSNVVAKARLAETFRSESNFVQSLVLFWEARDELATLMQGSIINAEDARPMLRAWNARAKEIEKESVEYAETVISNRMLRSIYEYRAALRTPDIREMNIARGKYIRLYEELKVLFSAPTGAKMVWRPPPPHIAFSEYNAIRDKEIGNWIKITAKTPRQRYFLSQICISTSRTVHAQLLNDALNTPGDGVSISWLAAMYSARAADEPYRFIFWYGLGNSYVLGGQRERANKAWTDAVMFFPDSVYVHYHLARTCGNSQLMNMRAISHLRWITEHAKNPVWCIKAGMEMAHRLGECNAPAEAARAASDAADLAARYTKEIPQDDYLAARMLESDMYLRAGLSDAAIASLRQALDIYPESIPLWRKLCDVYVALAAAKEPETPRYVEAGIRACDEVLSLNPEEKGIHAQKAYLYLLNENMQAAREEALWEIKVQPDSVSALTTLGYTYLAEGQIETAQIFFSKALDLNPQSKAARQGYERCKEENHITNGDIE